MDPGFWERLGSIWALIKPSNLFITDEQLVESQRILKNTSPAPSPKELQKHRAIVDSVLHPDTGEKILLPFRMSCFVPTNLVVTAGLLIPNPSTATVLFWQMMNQSVNVGFNIANANKSHPLSMKETISAYLLAVAVSCSVANGLNNLGRKPGISPWVARLAPFAAVSTANLANVYSTRWHEIKNGISVTDEKGSKNYGKSVAAAKAAVSQTAISRIATAFPVLVLSPLIMNLFERSRFIQRFPKLWIPLQLGVISGLMMTALPCALAIFPPRGKISIKDLEQDIAQQLPSGTSFLYFNKGL